MLVARWTEGLIHLPPHDVPIEAWWNAAIQGRSKEEKQRVAAILIYRAWGLWKERNRRIFDEVVAPPSRVVALTKEEMNLRVVACRGLDELLISYLGYVWLS
jgi:hypothetical protein